MPAPRQTILFIHPLGSNWTPGTPDMSRIANLMPPLGLCSLAAWVEKHGHRAAIHDCFAFPGRDDRIDAFLRTERPAFAAFSTTTSSFPDAVRIAARIKQAHPAVRTVFGGVHVSALGPALMADYPVIDFAVAGEGEEPLLALLDRAGEAPEEIPGVYYRLPGGEVAGMPPRKPSLDLDSLPFPAYGKLPGFPAAYKLPLFNYPRGPGTTAVSSRGCPYQCSYCDRSVFGKSYRFNSADYMADLVAHLRGEYGIRHINFYDDQFTFHRPRVEAFCKRLVDAGVRGSFNCAARAEHVDRELLRTLKRAGCWMISLGIETGDGALLERHRSHADLDMLRQRVEWIRAAGMRAKGLFMMGLPGETEASIDRSIDYVLSLPLDEFNLAKFTPFPGSPLYPGIREHGAFDEAWERMNCLNFVFVPNGFTPGRLEQRYHEFYRRYFQRPRILMGYVRLAWQSPESWMRFLRDLPAFLSVRKTFSK